MYLAFGGISGSGKDYLAKVLIEKYGYVRLSFSDQLKRIACQIFDWLECDYPPYEKEKIHTFVTNLGEVIEMTPRQIWLKMNFLREIENKIFIRNLDNQLKLLNVENIIITDIRTEDEFDYCKSKGFTTIYIKPEMKIYEMNNFDQQIHNMRDKFDHTFINNFNGTEEFETFIKDLLDGNV